MSETQTASLTEFLLAQIAEDEARASKSDDDGPLDSWHTRACPIHPQGLEQTWCDCDVPVRVLAECEAKRRIVEKAQRADAAFDQQINPASSAASFALAEVLQYLALPYADHPDFRAEWAL